MSLCPIKSSPSEGMPQIVEREVASPRLADDPFERRPKGTDTACPDDSEIPDHQRMC